jgi:Zn-dependent peptidase ImmA (M78 family)
MTKAATVHVPNGTLKWGRDRAKADLKEAAAKCGHSEAELKAWEDGEDPPLTALRELAAYYQLPLAAFLLSKPKDEPKPTVERRQFAGVDNPKTNHALAVALNRAASLQVVAADLVEGLDAAPFVVEANGLDAEALARRERALLGVTDEKQLSWRDDGQAFRRWREAIERRGVLVMQAPLGGSDVRAFSMHGDPPVIVVHRGDWVRAKVFSLAHELGHVAVGESGICIPGAVKATGVEAFCNEFADALLIPTDTMLNDRDARRIKAGEPATDQVVQRIANRFKVSPAVVWYRLKQTGVIGKATFDKQWTNWATWRPPPDDGGGPSDTAQNVVRDYGAAFPGLLLRAQSKGLVSRTDVSQYLGVPAATLPSIEQEVASRLTP